MIDEDKWRREIARQFGFKLDWDTTYTDHVDPLTEVDLISALEAMKGYSLNGIAGMPIGVPNKRYELKYKPTEN